jgi:hypothetical protein
MRLLIHIGNHKTGSTAIQTSLSNDRDELIANKILYFNTGRIKNAHHFWVNSVRKSGVRGFPEVPSIKNLIAEAIAEIEKISPRVAILSSEEFITLTDKDLKELNLFFDLFDNIDVVCYLRNQAAHFESSYKFSVFWPPVSEKRNFDDYLNFQLLESRYNDYINLLEKYFSYPKIDNVFLIDFDAAVQKFSLIKEFYRIIDGLKVYKGELKNNSSMTRIMTLGLLIYNCGFAKSNELTRDQVIYALSFIKPFDKESFYNEALYSKVLEYYRTTNEELFNNTGIDLNSHMNSKNIIFGGPYWRPRDIAKILECLCLKCK